MNHGHVTPNVDGSLARCGGPGICAQCSQELIRRDIAQMAAMCNEIIQLRTENEAAQNKLEVLRTNIHSMRVENNRISIENEALKVKLGVVVEMVGSEAVETHIRNLKWSEPNGYHQTLVAGNIRNFAGLIRQALQTIQGENK